MRAGGPRAGVLALCVLLFAVARSEAQAPPPAAPLPPQAAPLPGTGFVSPYEIMRTVRTAGFDPLVPPLREGTTYVLRALDYRGILMRVVVDAHTGAIRDANRIVPGPGRYGQYEQYGMIQPAYGPPVIYDPEDVDAPLTGPYRETAPAVMHPAPPHDLPPPLPRPRPASLASRKTADPGANPPPAADGKPNLQSDVTSATPPAAPAAPAPPAPEKTPPIPPIND